MNLVLDIGNNFFKVGIFENTKLIYLASGENCDINNVIEPILDLHENLIYVLISNVSEIDTTNLFKKSNLIVYELTPEFNLPFTIRYKTTETLGKDRIALAAAASTKYPNSNTVIIDAGTCITVDFLNDQNVFLGGAISPGIEMRYNSLSDYTANLPRLKKNNDVQFPGNSTNNSIHTGVILGITHEITGFINQIKAEFDDVRIILTGGDAKFLSKTLKITIFANQNFILEGLNSILNLNR
tara:strand:+ start:63 stop:785 length:723 start_codon:yes stop_codon:yes gene_type:complete